LGYPLALVYVKEANGTHERRGKPLDVIEHRIGALSFRNDDGYISHHGGEAIAQSVVREELSRQGGQVELKGVNARSQLEFPLYGRLYARQIAYSLSFA
jgi:hypothetical protein